MDVAKILSQAAEICGTRQELAEHLDVSVASIDKWRREQRIPAKHCLQIYRLTTVPLYKLNDVFPYELTLGKRWEERIVARLRRLKDRELLKDIETMLELETGE
jgi:DNA-binding transcriptional regulator YdaS (Cro superfamily)